MLDSFLIYADPTLDMSVNKALNVNIQQLLYCSAIFY